MKRVKQFTLLSIITLILWYIVIAIVDWDSTWIDFMPTATNSARAYFVLFFLIKIGLDVWLWSYIRNRYLDNDMSLEEAAKKAEEEKLKNMFNR